MTIADELIVRYREEGIPRIKLGVTDIDGVLRGKYISLDKFAGMAAGTSGFCDCVLGWDVDDQLYYNATFTGWHTAFPDALYRLDLTTERRLNDEHGIPYFIGEFVEPDNDFHPLCPRSRLRTVVDRANEMGFSPHLAFEYEFFLFRETARSARDKGYRDLVPLSPGNFGYSVLRTMTESDLFNALMDYAIEHDFPLEGLHCETGPGVWEAAIAVDKALVAADKASLFKTFSKAFFQKRELLATFMAKWSMDYPGQSGHCHQSLLDVESGRNVFFDAGGSDGMSETMRHYLGGLQKYMKPLLAITSPTINSYTRLVKGAWAPTSATWGIENRTCALRVIRGSEKAQRVEFRIGSADANPYLVAAANLGAGLIGIRDRIEPTASITGNAYEQEDQAESLASNLRDATRELAQSNAAREIFGDAFVDHFVASRDWEVREYERAVNDWQLQRYFEII
ncbi:MAG: glutamine synthetase family protein [Pseudomonadota bacterium]